MFIFWPVFSPSSTSVFLSNCIIYFVRGVNVMGFAHSNKNLFIIIFDTKCFCCILCVPLKKHHSLNCERIHTHTNVDSVSLLHMISNARCCIDNAALLRYHTRLSLVYFNRKEVDTQRARGKQTHELEWLQQRRKQTKTTVRKNSSRIRTNE